MMTTYARAYAPLIMGECVACSGYALEATSGSYMWSIGKGDKIICLQHAHDLRALFGEVRWHDATRTLEIARVSCTKCRRTLDQSVRKNLGISK